MSISRDNWQKLLTRKISTLVKTVQLEDDVLLYDCLEHNYLSDPQIKAIQAMPDSYKKAGKFRDSLMRIDSRHYLGVLRLVYKHDKSLGKELAEFLDLSVDHLEADSSAANVAVHPAAPSVPVAPTAVVTPMPASSPASNTTNATDTSTIPVNLQTADDQLILQIAKNPDKYYMMFNKPRGRAIILNNERFQNGEKLRQRHGSLFDVTNLSALFKGLEFTVDASCIWSNCTAQEIKERIQREKSLAEHSQADAFVFVAMSHGCLGAIYGTDGEKVHVQRDIIDQFDGNACPQLRRKPKLFFVQACQTEEPGSTPDDSFVFYPPANTSTHAKSDVLAFFATVPGYASYRDIDDGCWFVRDLISNINLLAHKHDIGYICTMVKNKLDERKTTQGYKQVAQDLSTLTKLLYLLPRHRSTE